MRSNPSGIGSRATCARELAPLVLIVLAALLLRLIDAGARLSHDEGYSWLVASSPNAHVLLARLARFENTPPLFYLLLAPLPLRDEFWLRLPSILAGTASVAVLYAIVRPLLGRRAALLASLGLATAPFAVSYSDYSRGFMVCGLGLLVALLGATRLACGGRRCWWLAYALGGAWALYSEYYAGLYLLAIIASLLVLAGTGPRTTGAPRPRETLLLGSVPFVGFAAWIPQLTRSVNDLGKTKLQVSGSAPSLRLIRDGIVPLFAGEHGVAHTTSLRDAEALVIVAVLGWACTRVARTAPRVAFWLLAGVLLMVLCLHLVVSAAGTDIFRERYMTTVIALAAAVLAAAVASVRGRVAVPAAAAALVALGAAVAINRAGREYEPNSAGAVAIVQADGFRTILTNSAVVAFYGRHLHVVLDRPFGLGQGVERSCAPLCAVIDDARFGGVRPGPGTRIALGPLVIRFPPRESRAAPR